MCVLMLPRSMPYERKPTQFVIIISIVRGSTHSFFPSAPLLRTRCASAIAARVALICFTCSVATLKMFRTQKKSNRNRKRNENSIVTERSEWNETKRIEIEPWHNICLYCATTQMTHTQ